MHVIKNNVGMKIWIFVAVLFGFFSSFAFADSSYHDVPPISQTIIEPYQEKTHRFEGGLLYEYLIPNTIYRTFGTLYLGYYIKSRKDFNYFFQANGYGRLQGNALLFTGGFTKDLGTKVYTYSSFSGGSNSAFLPQFRYDQDFNFKLGKNQSFILTGGFTTAKYFDLTNVIIFSGGATYANHDKFLLQYRIFSNRVISPGGVKSYAHLINLGYGKEGDRRTYFTGSFGKLAYLTSYLTSTADFQNNAWYVGVQHRKWFNDHQGGFFSINYLKLNGIPTSYDKYGIFAGIFNDY